MSVEPRAFEPARPRGWQDLTNEASVSMASDAGVSRSLAL